LLDSSYFKSSGNNPLSTSPIHNVKICIGDNYVYFSHVAPQNRQTTHNHDNICELKIDGIRLILSTVGGRTNLYSRHNTHCNAQFPELLDIKLPPDTILDGEICVTDQLGKPCFESVSKRNCDKTQKLKLSGGKRSWDWLKIVNYQYYQVVITGIKKRKHEILISLPNGASAGTVEFPFPPNERKALWGLVNQLKLEEDKNVIYLDPKLMIEVKSRGVTKNGYIRTPSFHRYCI
jgi:ATP-dependent DNA ligase